MNRKTETENSISYTPPLTTSPADINSHILKLVCNKFDVPFDSGIQEKMLDYHWKNNYDSVVSHLNRRQHHYTAYLRNNSRNFLDVLDDEMEELLDEEAEYLERYYPEVEEPIFDIAELRWRIHRKIMKWIFSTETSSTTGIDL